MKNTFFFRIWFYIPFAFLVPRHLYFNNKHEEMCYITEEII